MKQLLILLSLVLSFTFTTAGTVGLGWNAADVAEAYRVYVTPFRADYISGEEYNIPVCGGYYDSGTLVEDETCVNRDAPHIQLTGIADSSPTGMLWIAVRGLNEAGMSAEFSNDVAKHMTPPGNVGGVKRATMVISWVEGSDPSVVIAELIGLRIEPVIPSCDMIETTHQAHSGDIHTWQCAELGP